MGYTNTGLTEQQALGLSNRATLQRTPVGAVEVVLVMVPPGPRRGTLHRSAILAQGAARDRQILRPEIWGRSAEDEILDADRTRSLAPLVVVVNLCDRILEVPVAGL